MQHAVTTRIKIIIVAPPAMKGQKNITVSSELSDSPCLNSSAFRIKHLSCVERKTNKQTVYLILTGDTV